MLRRIVSCRRGLAILCLLLFGCGRQEPLPKTLPELRGVSETSATDARSARGAKDPKRAAAAAERALRCAKVAEELLGASATPTDADRDAKAAIAQAAAEARGLADLAREDAELVDRTTGLKARAYAGTRAVALAAVFRGLALAAEHAAKGGDGALQESVRNAAQSAAEISYAFAGRARPAAGADPDWPAVAKEMTAFADRPPAPFAAFLAVAFCLTGRTNLALIEAQALDADTFATLEGALPPGERRMAGIVIKGAVLSVAGLPRLGIETLETLDDSTALSQVPAEIVLAGIHLFAAVQYARLKDWKSTDREVARSIRVWPDNPVAVYLTGEQQAANGEWERAEESLEAAAKGTESEWLANRLADRARAVRDRRDGSEALVYDTRFQVEVVAHLVARMAKDSEAAKSVERWLENARSFGRRMMEHLPGGGDEAGQGDGKAGPGGADETAK